MKITWSDDAQSDLLDVWAFIAADDPKAAERIEDRLLEAAKSLSQYPMFGREGLRTGTRELVVPNTPYLLVYKLEDARVTIVRVWHGSRRPYGESGSD